MKHCIALALWALSVASYAAPQTIMGLPYPYVNNASGNVVAVNSDGQLSLTRLAGERNEESTTGTDYSSVSEECKLSAIIDLSVDASTTVYNGPAVLSWAYLSVTVGTAAATIDDNATAKLSLPVALTIGVHRFAGARFDTSLVVNPADTSTGTLTLCYRPLDAAVTW